MIGIRFCLILLFFVSESYHQETGFRDDENGRLPTALEPVHYDLELQPDIYTDDGPPFYFDGHVEVNILCRNSTSEIVLNAVGLTIINGSLELEQVGDPEGAPDIVDWELLPDSRFLVIYLGGELEVGEQYIISMDFQGELVVAMGPHSFGMFAGSYLKDGELRWVVGSQLQPSFARNVFPCFDEPGFKATFDVVMVRHHNMTAIGNGGFDYSEVRDDFWVADHFKTTPRMSTYLLAFVVVDYGYVEVPAATGQVSRIWARDDILHATQWVSEVVSPITEWMANYTDIVNVIQVINHVAIPGFGGAMENWGLILYDETTPTYDEYWYDSNNLRFTGTITGHELAHFWFGNLVTCAWWEHTWLNEGFASYFENFALEPIGWPGSQTVWAQRVVTVMRSDSTNTSTPVRPKVDTPWDLGRAFSTFVYNKGASVLRMLEAVLGSETFQRGLQNYLVEHEYSGAETDDLWEALTEQAAADNVTDVDGSPLDIKLKFDPWVDQAGYPVLTVTRNYEDNTVTFSQAHFNPNNQIWPPSPHDYMWYVPVTFISEDEPVHSSLVDVWLNKEESVTVSERVPEDDRQWILVNVGAKFFYRVLYDDQNMDSLISQLITDHTAIDVESRAALINDAFELARAGLLSEVTAFETTQYLDDEQEGLPWIRADDMWILPDRLLWSYPDTYSLLKTYILNLVDGVYESKGWNPDEDEPIYQIKLREVAIRLACKYGYENCVSTAVDMFEDWRDNPGAPNLILADQRPEVYCTGVSRGNQSDWDAVYNAYRTAGPSHLPNTSVEVTVLRDALACSTDTNTLLGYLAMIFNPDQIAPTQASAAMLSLARSQYGRQVVWAYIRAHWRDNPVPPGVSLKSVMEAVVQGFATPEDEIMMDEFWAQYPPEDDTEQEIYESTRDILADNRDWADTNQQDLHDWLLPSTV